MRNLRTARLQRRLEKRIWAALARDLPGAESWPSRPQRDRLHVQSVTVQGDRVTIEMASEQALKREWSVGGETR